MGSRQKLDKSYQFAYIAGFLDGDGYITIKIEKMKTCILGHRARVRVGFCQSKSRRFVLDQMREIIGSGVVSEYKHNNMAEYVISDQKSIFDLLEHLSPYLIVKKKQLKLAKKFLLLKKCGYSKYSLSKMIDMSNQMSNYNSYPKFSV